MVKGYPEHISLDEANEIIRNTFKGRVSEHCVNIKDALGCVLSRDIKAERNVPHFAASAVDGYAVRSSSTIGAASATPVKLEKGLFQWVNTGSDLPTWADSVLMVEDSSTDEDAETLTVFRSLPPSMNLRPLGEDVMAGQIIAREGDVVSPALVSLFLCAGIESVPVVRRPKALFIPTGDEIISQAKWLSDARQKSGTAAESNSLFIEASFKNWGYEIDIAPILPDDPNILLDKIMRGAENYDLVLIGAGSAKGRRDHTLEVFERAGRVLFRWLRMKPGRPAMAAEVSSKPVICLPGSFRRLDLLD